MCLCLGLKGGGGLWLQVQLRSSCLQLCGKKQPLSCFTLEERVAKFICVYFYRWKGAIFDWADGPGSHLQGPSPVLLHHAGGEGKAGECTRVYGPRAFDTSRVDTEFSPVYRTRTSIRCLTVSQANINLNQHKGLGIITSLKKSHLLHDSGTHCHLNFGITVFTFLNWPSNKTV